MEMPTATIVASCFQGGLPMKSPGRLRSAAKECATSLAWSEFESSVTAQPTYVEGSFVAGLGYGAGEVAANATFKVTGDVRTVRSTAVSIAKQFDQHAVRVNFEAAAEPMLFEHDLFLSDWRIEYLLPRASSLVAAESAWWLVRDAPVEAPAGRIVADRLVVDAGLGFVARAHRVLAERFGRPISVSSILVERWGKDGEQRGFLREQRIERASDDEIGRILLA
ncbi:MAG: hypothetical protein M0Z33_04700 [Actinomycetota bacterium]|nr:hypothetical protein [Actinomycetota bacterium]